MTHGLLSLGLGSGEELGGGEVAEGLVGADGIVGMLPGAEFRVQGGKGEVGGGDLLELLGMRTLSAFDVAVEFRGTWGQDEKFQTPRLAGGLELGGELAAAVDLQGAQGEG